MGALLLAYSATAYLFSGSVCYLASQNNSNQDIPHSALKPNQIKLTTFWVTILWPLWIFKEIKTDTQAVARISTSKVGEYLPQNGELISTVSRGSRYS